MSSPHYVGRHGSARHARPRPPMIEPGSFAGNAASLVIAGLGLVGGCAALVAVIGATVFGPDAPGSRQDVPARSAEAGRHTVVTDQSEEWSAPDAVTALPGTKKGGHGTAGILDVEVESTADEGD